MRKLPILVLSSCPILALLLPACGGAAHSPASDIVDTSDVRGIALDAPFHVSGIVSEREIYTGEAQIELSGHVTGSMIRNVQDGGGGPLVPASRGPGDPAGVGIPALPLTGLYETWPDGTLRLWTDGLFGQGVGAVCAAGDVGAVHSGLGGPLLGEPPGLSVLLRPDPTVDAAVLAGTYRYVSMLLTEPSPVVVPPKPDVLSSGGTLVLDGGGGAQLVPDFLSINGVHVATETEPGLFTLAGDGTLMLDLGSVQLQGAVGRGGEILSLAGGTEAGQDAMLLFAIRQGTGHGDASLEGGYTSIVQETGGEYLGRFSADGAGTGGMSAVAGPGRGPLVSVAPWTYDISPDGRLDLAFEVFLGSDLIRHAYVGALSQSGDLAFLVGGGEEGLPPSLVILVETPTAEPATEIRPDPFQSGTVTDPLGRVILGSSAFEPLATSFGLEVGEASTAIIFGRDPSAHRGLLRFDLGGIAPGRRIASAQLRTTQDAVSGAPFTSRLREVLVDHVDFGGAVDDHDFDPARRALGSLGTISDREQLGERVLDVTAALQADLDDGRTTTDFLLYFSFRDNSDDVLDDVSFDAADPTEIGGPSTGPRTRLLIGYR